MNETIRKELKRLESKLKYKDFPEFEDTVPDEILINSNTLDEIQEKNSRDTRHIYLERSRGELKGKTQTKKGWFPPEKRIEVATAFVAGMTNSSRLEELTKIPAGTIRQWKIQPWWGDLLERVKVEKDVELDSKFTKIIDKTLDRVVDSIEHGDSVLRKKMDKDGIWSDEIVKVPMKGKEAAGITAQIFDKRQLLRGKPTARVEVLSQKEQLKELRDEFRRFAGAKVINAEVQPVQSNVVHTAIEADYEEIKDEN